MLRQRLLAARKNDEGFTLIELLIVVVVIGILAGITIFGVDAFKNDGKSAVCKSDLKNAQIAVQAFYAKNSFTYPTTIDQLVKGGYLQSTPGTTLAIAADGTVTANGTAGC
ncbi:competence type IV pilus major pilin ComGC [Actinoplanes subtropicus]|uniref:competence type IV pilus major pilin ComGC n=1 Tax=Actinoplanes subtropicus TaxID=543632 RepID=UPI0004C40FEC|nr:prepilin-type N-terminal cleavage/methylation domain-containing protein [Actinoplanes subtropicus]